MLQLDCSNPSLASLGCLERRKDPNSSTLMGQPWCHQERFLPSIPCSALAQWGTTSPTSQRISSSCRTTFTSQSHFFPEELAEIILISHIPAHLTSPGLPEPFFLLPPRTLCALSSTFINPPSASSHGALKTQRRMKRHKAEHCCHQTPLPNSRHCYLLLNFVYSCADTLPPTWQYFIQDKFEFTSRTFQRIPKHLFTNSMR